jgi:hypothetical protein
MDKIYNKKADCSALAIHSPSPSPTITPVHRRFAEGGGACKRPSENRRDGRTVQAMETGHDLSAMMAQKNAALGKGVPLTVWFPIACAL